MKRKLFVFPILALVLGLTIAVFVSPLFFPQPLLLTVEAQDAAEAEEDEEDEEDAYDNEEVESDYCEPQYELDHFECTEAVVCGGKLVEIWCDVECGEGCQIRNPQDCGLAQTCNAEKGSCVCSARECYPAPEPKDIKDAALFPRNVFESSHNDGPQANPNKLKLPVNLGWSDANEWPIANSIPFGQCSVESYRYEILRSGGPKVFEQHIQSPSTSPLEERILQDVARGTQDNKEQCSTLLGNQTYTWRVQDCSDAAGQDCSTWSTSSSFTTSSAPELKAPYDLDWEKEIDSAKVRLPVTLTWCETPGTASWRIKLYREEVPVIETEDELTKEYINVPLTFDPQETSYADAELWKVLDKNVKYFWELLSCRSRLESSCSNIRSQLWSVVPSDTPLPAPILLAPQNGAVVNKLDKLSWQANPFAQRYLVQLEKQPRSAQDPFGIDRAPRIDSELALDSLFGWENNKVFTWKVAPCWGTLTNTGGKTDTEIEEQIKSICETTETGEVQWSETRRFKTTGAAPINLGVKPEGRDPADPIAGKVSIPILLEWDGKDDGAASYYYEVATNPVFSSPFQKGVLQQSEVSLTHSQIKSGADYWMRVQSCAEKLGKTCGQWSQIQLTTADLASQQLSSPKQGEEQLLSIAVVANQVFGAKFYNYALKYLKAPDEETAACKNSVGQGQTPTLPSSSTTLKARCTGEYQIQTRACVDKDCNDAGTWSLPVKFQVVDSPGPTFGLVPCGADRNFTNTPTDDRDPCEVKHLLLILHNIIDFLLWKLTLIIVVLMAALTGVILFFSFGGPEALVKVKAIWRAIGLGALILLFAWFFLNLLLGVVGFNVGVFGNWFEVKI